MYRKLLLWSCLVLVLGLTLTSTSSAGLVAWWRLDDGSGTTAMDSSGNGNDGIVEGGAQWVAGQLGGALQFNGSDAEIRGPHIPLNNQSFTITMWINPVLSGSAVVFSQAETGSTNLSMHYRLGGPSSTDAPVRGIRMGFYSNDLDTPSDLLQDNTWYHITFWYDFENQIQRVYVDGEQVAERSANPYLGSVGDTLIGVWQTDTSQRYEGIVDDVQIYDHPLTETEILAVMRGLEGYPYASNPSPEDGTLYSQTWVSMSWRAGDFAVSHDVYMGDNFDDVNDGTRDSESFRGNQDLGTEFYFAGFAPGAYPDGLVNGTTYYWRIDEINDADPNSPWKGKVWSFTVPPRTAYNPAPSDGSKFVATDTILSWATGFEAIQHTVYFGDDYDTVANATSGGTTRAQTNFSPGPLEIVKTYYWRVDETAIGGKHTGEVWSFTTAKEGGGIRGDYYRGMNFETHVLTRTDNDINFNWGDPGGPDPLVGDDQFSCRWTGEVEAAYTETYTFYAAADDGVRLWVDGVQLVNAWVDQGTTEYRGTIDLVAGNSYSVVMEQYENGGGATAYLRWSSPSTPKQIIPQAALAPPVKASSPSPFNGATGTKMTPILRWGAGDFAGSHEVYFGTDADAVANADKSSPEYKGTKALGDESFDPGKLAWFTQYFWRIDEVNNLNPDSPWMGNTWNFTTGDFLVVDDFEDYDAADNQIWYSWIDGLGFGAPGTDPYNPGNGTGSAVGDETSPSYTEETIVHGGRKSMPLNYDNDKQGYSKYSETELTLTATRDWTEEGVANLSLWFRGYPASVGSFVEGPVGTFTMTGSGADIWVVNGVEADEFHFAYKMLTGAGSMVARIQSVDNTNVWAKAGVMIRETLEPDSSHAMMVVTPAQGVSFQRRPGTGATSLNTDATGIAAPYWVKIERDLAGNFTGYSSANGTTWNLMGIENIPMGANTYIGLALTSHDATLTCQAVFTNVTTTGNVTGQWANQDIGILSNNPEPLYVAVSNNTGTPAVVVHDDPAAATINTWTEWVIPLQTLVDQGIVLTNVDRIAIGLGTQGNMTIPGGSGKMFIDDIRLYQPAPEPEPESEPEP